MSGALVGLALGAGLFCLWWSWWPTAASTSGAARRRRLTARLSDDLTHSGAVGVSARALLGLCAAVAVVAGALVTVATAVPAIGACFGLISGWAPVAVVRSRARRRRTALREVWPEAVDNVASGVRAGLSLAEALGQLASRGPEELRPAFSAFAHDYRATGRFSECLDALKDRLRDPVADRLVETLRLAREVGGTDLGRLLRTLSTFLREDARARGELETRQGWTVNGARVAVAAPWVVLALLASRPAAVAAYARPAGAVVLAVGGAVSAAAYRLMVRIGRLPDEPRVLQ